MSNPATSIRDLIPSRDQLLAEIANANRFTMPLVVLHLFAIVVVAFFVDWVSVANNPWLYLAAISAVLGPFVAQILRILAQNKKEIGDLRETTWFGVFDKHLLRELFDDTLKKLGLPNEQIPVYITADRTLNAYASHVGLGFLSRRLNGIYLNRQLLHKLEPAEVQDTMGHELGHYYAHYLKRSRYRFLSCLLGGVLAIAVAQWMGLDLIFGYLALLCVASVAFYFTSAARTDHVQMIEYLCDDFGAHVNGIETGINALMKLGAAGEIETTIFFESILSNQFANLSAAEILETLQQAIPYGHVSPEELQQAIGSQLKKKASQGASIAGFLKYAWDADDEEDVDERLEQQAKIYQKIRQSPRLDWESLLDDPTRINFTGEKLEQLIEMIESNPGVPLFHQLPADQRAQTHPPTKLRILYLWYNRQAIASSPALPS